MVFGAWAMRSLPPEALATWIALDAVSSLRLARRIDPRLFYRLVYLGMLLTGTKLVWDALS